MMSTGNLPRWSNLLRASDKAWKGLDAALPQMAASSSLCWEDPEELCRPLGSSPTLMPLAMRVARWLSTKSPSFLGEVTAAQLTFQHRAPHCILPPRSHCTGNQKHKGPTSFDVPMSSNRKDKNGARAGYENGGWENNAPNVRWKRRSTALGLPALI